MCAAFFSALLHLSGCTLPDCPPVALANDTPAANMSYEPPDLLISGLQPLTLDPNAVASTPVASAPAPPPPVAQPFQAAAPAPPPSSGDANGETAMLKEMFPTFDTDVIASVLAMHDGNMEAAMDEVCGLCLQSPSPTLSKRIAGPLPSLPKTDVPECASDPDAACSSCNFPVAAAAAAEAVGAAEAVAAAAMWTPMRSWQWHSSNNLRVRSAASCSGSMFPGSLLLALPPRSCETP